MALANSILRLARHPGAFIIDVGVGMWIGAEIAGFTGLWAGCIVGLALFVTYATAAEHKS
jgi:hypothetical protein